MTSTKPIELSVIVATHNRREMLRRCLDSLASQTQDPASFEVIVADDGSSDGTAEMAEALDAPYRLRVLRLEQAGQAATQNAALELVQEAICLFLDDDVIASPELVAEHLAAHREDPGTLGIGAIEQKPPPGRDWYAHTFARSWNAHYEEFDHRAPTWIDCYGANFSISRGKLREIGGFTTDILSAIDLEAAFRLCHVGCVPRYLPRAHGVHDDRKGRVRMLADARRQGAAHVEVVGRLPKMEAEFLDWSRRAGPLELKLRRLLIALRFPPAPLALLGPLVPGAERQVLWFSIVRRFGFWLGVRESVDRDRWEALTGADPASRNAVDLARDPQ